MSNSPELRKALCIRFEMPVLLGRSKSFRVKYIDSSGVASLVEGLKASRDMGFQFCSFRISASAREVLQLSRLLKF